MAQPIRRCYYMNEQGLQCETWFPVKHDDSKLCDVHRNVATTNGTQEQKVLYINLVNEERAICYKMSPEELDAHIAQLEKVLEETKAKILQSKAVRKENYDKLTEEERKELRKIRVDHEVKKSLVPEREKAPSFKKDPIANLMQSKGFSKEDARDLMSMDEDALLEKFRAMRAKKESGAEQK